jgi:hypothetical protein
LFPPHSTVKKKRKKEKQETLAQVQRTDTDTSQTWMKVEWNSLVMANQPNLRRIIRIQVGTREPKLRVPIISSLSDLATERR